jgi:hypothetical protein
LSQYDYSSVLWHDKGSAAGMFEAAYFDVVLDDGTVVVLAYMSPSPFNAGYIQAVKVVRERTGLHWNPSAHADVLHNITDSSQTVLFNGVFNPDPAEVLLRHDSQELQWSLDNRLSHRLVDGLPEMTLDFKVPDGAGNVSQGRMVFTATCSGICVDDGSLFDEVIDGERCHLQYHIVMPAARVSADITITDARGNVKHIRENGIGYHDKMWSSHHLFDLPGGWKWARITEPDLCAVFMVDVPFKKDPHRSPQNRGFLIHKNEILTGTRFVDTKFGEMVTTDGVTHHKDLTMIFQPESEVTGEVRFSNLRPIHSVGTIMDRFVADYEVNISSPRTITRRGKGLCEHATYPDL